MKCNLTIIISLVGICHILTVVIYIRYSIIVIIVITRISLTISISVPLVGVHYSWTIIDSILQAIPVPERHIQFLVNFGSVFNDSLIPVSSVVQTF